MTDWVVSDLLALSDLTAAAQEYTTTWHTHTYTYVRMRRATKMGEGRRHCYTDGRQYGARGRTAQHGSYRSPMKKKKKTRISHGTKTETCMFLGGHMQT